MSEDTKLKELIINTLSPEQMPEVLSDTEIYLVEDDAEYATVEELATKQDKLTVGNGIDITNNKISTNTQFNITEDMFDVEYDSTKGVAPYDTSYDYTNVTIHENAGIEWVNGAIYSFVLDTKTAKTDNRNVRLRIGESGEWKPLMGLSSTIANGYAFFVKTRAIPFQYKSTYIEGGALHTMYYDTDTTYTINYLYDAGRYHSGIGTYAITRYSLVLQKPDGTWEKCTDTTKTYSTGTTKTVNKRGFLLNQIKYYRYTSAYANGALVTANYLCSQASSVNTSYSFNCGTAPGWALGDYIYLVGTIGSDGLFYLDETKWWDNKLPTTNDGKIYIQLGSALSTTDSTMTFLNNRPILYHDGTSIREYIPHDNTKQNKLTAGENITIENDVISVADDLGFNNPFSLLDSKYSDHTLSNASWLLSKGQLNSGTVYVDVYNLLVKLLNGTETIEGISVKAVGDSTITDYDFVVDTANTQFRLPIKSILAGGKAVVGNEKAIGITNGDGNYGLGFFSNATYAGLAGWVDNYGKDISTTGGVSGTRIPSGSIVGLTTDSAKSGIETDTTSLYLYYYIGETVQNANLINAGRIAEQLAGKVDGNKEDVMLWGLPDYSKGIVITQATSLNYTVPANGFINSVAQSNGAQQVYINDNLVWDRGSTQGTYGYSFTLPVSKNDVVKTQGLNAGASIYFFPLKGVN